MSKRKKAFQEKVDANKVYALDEALDLLKELKRSKFDESVDVAANLGVDTRKSDQNVRGAVVLPHGLGKTVRVAVFAAGEAVQAAKDAGADIVGGEDLAEDISKGNMDFDIVIATPDTMRIVGKLGQILGPKGLMPNPKLGTVTADVATAIKNAKSGQARYRAEKGGIAHCSIGKISFENVKLKENLSTLVDALKKAKPEASKGVYLKKITLSTTMGPGITIDLASI